MDHYKGCVKICALHHTGTDMQRHNSRADPDALAKT